MLRYIGYFIHHTIKPLIEELDKLLGQCKNLTLDKKYIEKLIKEIISLEIQKAMLLCVAYIIVAQIIFLMVWKIIF